MPNNKNTINNKLPNIDYMWWKLPLVKNTTNMIKGKWSDTRSKNITGNHAVITGEENNITGLDLDFGYKLSDEELNSNPITKKFIDLFGKEPKWDTYTVRTKSGGLHYYFEYDPEIKQTQDEDCKIDIRGKGGCLYGAGTIVTKGQKQGVYKCINNKKQMKMPDVLKEFLLENLYTKKEKSKKTTTTKNEKKKTKSKNYDESYYEYNFTDDILRDVFDGLPPDYWRSVVSQDGEPSFLVWTGACKALDKFDLWDEYNQKYDNYDYDKNERFWESADVSYNCMTNLLKHTSFPNALKMIDYHKYQPILQNEIQPDIEVHSEKLGYDYFQKDINYIVKSDTGTGKTTSFQKYIEKTNDKFISITSRISLAEDQYKRFSSEINDVYYYQNLTNDMKGKLLGLANKDNKDYNNFIFKGSVVVEIESLITRLEYATNIVNINEMVVFLDEFNSLIQHIIQSSTLENTLTFILDQFIYILKNCKQIICADADISDTAILWFKENIGREFEFHKNNHKHNKDIKAEEIISYDDLLDKLHKNEKWLVPCDSRLNAMLLHKKFPDAELVIAETLEIPNLDDHDRIIYSPKITNGVDSVMERPVFAFFEGKTVDPATMVQMICRCRNITKLHYYFTKKSFKAKNINYNDVWDDIMNKHSKSLKYFKNRYFQQFEKGYLNTLHRIEYDKKCYSSNAYAHFKKLISDRGFIDINLYKNSKNGSFTHAKKDLKREIEGEIESDFECWCGNNGDDYIKNEKAEKKFSDLQKILKLPDEDKYKYKNYFINDKAIYAHWNKSTMFFKKDIAEKFDNFDYTSENFTINKITKEKTKMKFLQDMKKACGCPEPLNIQPTKIIDNSLLEDYKVIFRCRSKTLKADTIYDCQKIIVTMYKNLFGKFIIDTKENDKKKGSTKEYNVNDKSLQKDYKLYTYRETKTKKNDCNFDDFDNITDKIEPSYIPDDYEWRTNEDGCIGYFPKKVL